MSQESEQVQRHFHRTAAEFDSIYSGKKSWLAKFLDKRFRWDMQARMEMTLEACQPVEGKTVIDLGCGTGRFCFPLAEQGAVKVVGIDFAASMIEEAIRLAGEKGLTDRCSFGCTDILDINTDEKYDFVIAIGLFDYFQEDRNILQKMRQVTKGSAIMSFPRSDTWRAPIRKIRLGLQDCPVYFYTEKRIRDHLMIAGFTIVMFSRVGKLFFVVAE